LALTPVPTLTTFCIIAVICFAVSAETTRRVRGAGARCSLPSAPTTALTSWGCTHTPPLAMVLNTWIIWRALTETPWPIGTAPMSVPFHRPKFMMPCVSCGKSRPDGAPRPNFSRYDFTFVSPSCCASMIVPMFDDCVRMSVTVQRVVGCGS
jgi:hypothetical protein